MRNCCFRGSCIRGNSIATNKFIHRMVFSQRKLLDLFPNNFDGCFLLCKSWNGIDMLWKSFPLCCLKTFARPRARA
nr:hypothetical protein CFP56_05347 [Quercus suber]